MDQVDELLDTIVAHKEMEVTGASVMFPSSSVSHPKIFNFRM
jgi:hypothetical protein